MNQREIALLAAKALDDKRAKDITVLKVDEMTVITDYMVIATGRSVPQVKALADNVDEELAKQDAFAKRREGYAEGRWCVLDYGDVLSKNGLSLLNGPGNDIVAITNLMAAGVHIILFTTGRGTPVGAPVPTIKIATNHSLAERKTGWIDFDASPTLEGNPLTEELFDYVVSVAEGRETKDEINDYREISIFKDGVTL